MISGSAVKRLRHGEPTNEAPDNLRVTRALDLLAPESALVEEVDLVYNTYFSMRTGVEALAGEGWHRIKRCGTATGSSLHTTGADLYSTGVGLYFTG